jgi:large subunit ribosomal protein L5e
MAFVKVVKTKAYFKRFQVKWRRRREGKTDYRARKRLINQEKSKYYSPKYRLCVRITAKDIICQVISAKIIGDEVMTAAYAHELTKFGMPGPLGLTNYAAAYATGLLCARRTLAKLGLESAYEGQKEIDGEVFNVTENDDGPRPFRALLDVGLKRITTGSRSLGVAKGASDGGLLVPHNEKRFPGYDRESKSYDAEGHKHRIMGTHVADYMRYLEEEDADKYQTQFSRWIKAGVDADSVEPMYEKIHAAIRKNPITPKKAAFAGKRKPTLAKKQNRLQRINRVSQKKKAFLKRQAQDA